MSARSPRLVSGVSLLLSPWVVVWTGREPLRHVSRGSRSCRLVESELCVEHVLGWACGWMCWIKLDELIYKFTVITLRKTTAIF
jgi:hypothetical protein